MNPTDKPPERRILLVITGLTPQVVTETVYALHRQDPDSLPTEIHLLSTAEGVERARLTLLGDDPGWFGKLSRDYSLPAMQFDADCLHSLSDAEGCPLRDIRTPEDNECAANGITRWVRDFTADPGAALHVSLAGGRKTMGFYAGYALSLYGRGQDRLSHVLVEPPFESHPEFYYPTPHSRVIYAQGPDRKPLDTQAAKLTLAEIPFVRMRHGLPQALLTGKGGFTDSVQAAQTAFAAPSLRLDLLRRQAGCGGKPVKLPPAELAFYAWLARRVANRQEPIPCPSDGVPDRDYAAAFLREHRLIIGQADNGRVEAGLENGMDKGYFLSHKARLNTLLKRQLGADAQHYLVGPIGKRPRTTYGLALGPEWIQLKP